MKSFLACFGSLVLIPLSRKGGLGYSEPGESQKPKAKLLSVILLYSLTQAFGVCNTLFGSGRDEFEEICLLGKFVNYLG